MQAHYNTVYSHYNTYTHTITQYTSVLYNTTKRYTIHINTPPHTQTHTHKRTCSPPSMCSNIHNIHTLLLSLLLSTYILYYCRTCSPPSMCSNIHNIHQHPTHKRAKNLKKKPKKNLKKKNLAIEVQFEVPLAEKLSYHRV